MNQLRTVTYRKKRLRKGFTFRFFLLIANIIGLATIIFSDNKNKY